MLVRHSFENRLNRKRKVLKMASVLSWKSFQLCNYFYRYMYPHVISVDVENQRIIYEQNKSKLIPFYFVNIVLSFILLCCLYLVATCVHNSSVFANYLATYFVSMAGLSIVIFSQHAIMINYGQELCTSQYYLSCISNSLKTNCELRMHDWNMKKPCYNLILKGIFKKAS